MTLELPVILFLKGEKSQFEELSKIVDGNKFKFHSCTKFEEAFILISKLKPCIILIDLMFDKRDAINVISEIGSKNLLENSLVAIFSDRKENYVQISALNAGADDYLVKPVNKRVFESKLNSWVRRAGSKNKALQINGNVDSEVTIDEDRFTLSVREEEIALQRKEFEIISLLYSRPKKVFTRHEIKEFVWGENMEVRNRTIDVHIRNLRSKIGPKYIKTIKGVGYSYTG